MITKENIKKYQKVRDSLKTSQYQISLEQYQFFWENGYLGPFRCEAPEISQLSNLISQAGLTNYNDNIPMKLDHDWRNNPHIKHINIHDPHLKIKQINNLVSHPSIINPVAQLLGSQEIKFFQSRFRLKFPKKEDPVPWHQDVGNNNGGCYVDGNPIPTLTVWLGIDGSTEASGCLKVMPKTHKQLFGDWQLGFNAKLEEQEMLDHIDLSQAHALETKPSEFYIFHSWILHTSLHNTTDSPRTGFVMRFVASNESIDSKFRAISCYAK